MIAPILGTRATGPDALPCPEPLPTCTEARCRWHLGDSISIHQLALTREVWMEMDTKLPAAIQNLRSRRVVPIVLRQVAESARGAPRELGWVVERCTSTTKISAPAVRGLLHRLRELGAVRMIGWDREGSRMCVLHEIASYPDGMPLEAIGDLLGVTRERIRQVERIALAKVAAARGQLS